MPFAPLFTIIMHHNNGSKIKKKTQKRRKNFSFQIDTYFVFKTRQHIHMHRYVSVYICMKMCFVVTRIHL